ncbi:MAG: aminotransferase class V-fold PLP-dependent enzyme [Actinobacteria bacterium]|nr:aminotransferase class V-fold PLP-dependent enzyme [Actinomycetota bacterium]
MSHDQRGTPYLDAVLRYRATGYTPFHTPGHKLGRGAPEGLRELLGDPCLQVDIAMAGGVEDTRESTHLIRLAEDYAAEAWGSDRCWFLVNGSTSGIHSLVLTLCGPGDEVIIPRNAHKSMLAGLIFSGAMPVYLEPDVDPLWGIPLTLSAEVVHRALAEHPAAKAIFVTSPTYNGLGADLGAVAAAAHAAGVPFVTDQAWGPHLRFSPELPVDAMTAGADAAVVSTHKLISGITQTSVLMARAERINLARLDSMVGMTQSTSPQVLMYASIDAARQQMATRGAELWRGAIEQARWARDELNRLPGVRCLGEEALSRQGVASFDPTRLTISSCDLGHSGYELETVLRDDYRIAVEAADPLNVVLNVTYGDSHADLEKLVAAFRDYAGRRAGQAGGGASAACAGRLAHAPAFTRQVLSPREAFFAPSVALPLAECAARVSAEMVTPYPPGIPVLGPGEAISDEIVAYLHEGAMAGFKVHGPEDRTLRSLRVVA